MDIAKLRALHEQGTAAYARLQQAISDLTTTDWPQVIVTKKGRLKCPHCGIKNRFQELDYGLRENEAEVEHRESGTYVYISQGDRDFHTLAFQCWQCSGLVTIPGEVEVLYS